MARPEHEPTDKTRGEVLALRTYGIPIKDVAAYLGIDDKTLYKHYKEELIKGKAQAHSKVGKFLYEAATGEAMRKSGATPRDCITAAIFWAKTQMGFSEVQKLEHTSPDGSMSPTRIEIVAPNDNSKG